jgi:hypothetical protein
MNKILVLYVFHIYNDRVKHFLDNSVFDDENVDFLIISNDKNNYKLIVLKVIHLPIKDN